jgi:hypothetical protein
LGDVDAVHGFAPRLRGSIIRLLTFFGDWYIST